MALIRIQLAVSADGFISPSDGSFDWLSPFPAEEFGLDAFLANVGTVLMGRTSYEEVQKMGPTPYGSLPTLVVTSRALPDAPAHVRPIALAELSAEVAALRTERKDTWLFGGARTIAACLERHLVDTLELAVIPRLLGDGLPLFVRRSPTLDRLRLVEARPMTQDVLWLRYDVVRD